MTTLHSLRANTLAPLVRQCRPLRRHAPQAPTRHLRPFVSPSWPVPAPQTLSASRTLPYASGKLFAIVADVGSYSSFLPYCSSAAVTAWSRPDRDGRSWPREAEMRVGWGGVEERVASSVYCVPDRIVEAVSGAARTTIPEADLPHYPPAAERSSAARDEELFRHLLTTWTLKSFPYKPPPPDCSNPQEASAAHTTPREQTEVHLAIEFQFANPLYAALSKAAAPRVAGIMIEAFERRAAELLGAVEDRGAAGKGKDSALEGVLSRGERP
ncbi:MAG: hypothetical protein M1832_002294 [Thelocarpon impressellum]|nr:MAG: hypothetical protein M1832_002294 [Thelocarpon impressellum]